MTETDITIPDDALRAAVEAYHETRWTGDVADLINAACLAMLKAWPGMEYMMGDEAFPFHYIILPLQENSDE